MMQIRFGSSPVVPTQTQPKFGDLDLLGGVTSRSTNPLTRHIDLQAETIASVSEDYKEAAKTSGMFSSIFVMGNTILTLLKGQNEINQLVNEQLTRLQAKVAG